MTEQPTSTARLFQQPPRPDSPVIPPPQLSLGPEPVTDEMRAEERKERTGDPPPKKIRKTEPKKQN